MITIIIPTFNEASDQILQKNLSLLSNIDQLEIICVDGGSKDGTLKLIEQYDVKLIKTIGNSRAHRINSGVKEASHELLLIVHPRSIIDINCIQYLKTNRENLSWGGLIHKFDNTHPLLKFTSWYSNNVRTKIFHILYLDHCLFIKKELIQRIGLVPEVDIFEDTLLSQKLKKITAPEIIPFISKTSAIRFKQNGFFQQAILNQFMKIGFFLKVPNQKLNALYEKGLDLNSKYLKNPNSN